MTKSIAHLKSYLPLILSTGGLKIYKVFVSLLTLWLTFKILGADVRGVFIVALTWVKLASGLGHLSVGQTILHHTKKGDDKKWLAMTLGSAITVTLLMTGIIWMILGGLSLYDHHSVYGQDIPQWVLFFILLGVPFFIWDFYGTSLWTSVNQLQKANKIGFVSQTLSLCMLPLMFVLNILGAIISALIAPILNMIASIKYFIKDHSKSVAFSGDHTKNLIKKSLQLHPAIIFSIIIAYSDILMVNHFIGATDAGFYQMAVQLIAAIIMIPQTMTMILFTITSKQGQVDGWRDSRVIIGISIVMMIVISIVAYYCAPYIIPFIFGDEAIKVATIFSVLIFSVMGQSMASLLSPQWIGYGFFKTISAIGFVMMVINITLNILLIPPYGVEGAAIATCITFMASIFINGGMIIYSEINHRSKLRIKTDV